MLVSAVRGQTVTGKIARFLAASALVIACASATAWASETITYQYDELGRLKKVTHSGTVNNNVTTNMQYDPAGNRSNYSVTGSTGVAFSISDVVATEGGSLVFTVTKTGSATASYSINYATVNGTALAGSDYTAATGTLAFVTADTTKTVTIATINNTTAEPSEVFYVDLSGATGGATISDPRGLGTINDND